MSMIRNGGPEGGGGSGGVTNHNNLIGRELPDQHPVNSITGLAAALASTKYRGAYPSLLALQTAYPADVPGAYASVVQAGDASMYIWNDNDQEWQDSGESGVWVISVNGLTGPNIVLAPADIGAISEAILGEPGGIPVLGPDGRIPISMLPVSGISLNHENCTNRDAADSHPMGAITGLSAAVAGLSETLADEAEAREDADAALNNAKVDKTASSTGEWMESIDVEHDDPDSVTVRVYTSKLDGSESGIEYEKTIYGAVPPGGDPEAEPGAAGLLTAPDKALLDGLPARIDSLTGKLRYMPANDFETDTPAQEDLTAWAEDHTGLDHVENSTAAVNLFDNHEWIYNETGSEWIDNGLTAVSTATNTSLGVVKGSAAGWGVSAGSDGAMTVNTVDAGETAKGIVQFATDAEISGASPPEGKAVSAAGMVGYVAARAAKFFIGEYYHQLIIRPGFVWANGQVLEDVSENYPLLKAWLLNTGPYGGAVFRKTLTEWNAEWNDPKWNAPDSAGARAGMSPFYVLDESADTIKVSDLRGAYQAAAGFNGQTSGKTFADAIRAIKTANAGFTAQYSKSASDSTTAPFTNGKQWSTTMWATQTADANWGTGYAAFDVSLVHSVDAVVHPRSIVGYLCFYAGAPA